MAKKYRVFLTDTSDYSKHGKYVVVATSLPETISAIKILELYRMRWQIELVFKLLNFIFGGDFCVKKKEAVETWFYGKLLLAVICQTFVKRCRFSPGTKISMIENYKFSLWKELQTMLYLVSDIIADSFYFDFSMEMFNNLPIYCADLKLKRLPALFTFINVA